MSELRLIVQKLNGEPFKKSLSLVSFDEQSGTELIGLLNDVLAKCDPGTHDVNFERESVEMRVFRHMDFMQMMRYKFPSEVDSFREGLGRGDRGVMYPVLHWALSNFEMLKKRAYLGRYLMPVEVPTEFQQDEAVSQNLAHYKQMQQRFKVVHKEVEKLRTGTQPPTELKAEITQLEDEKRQLKDKIRGLETRTRGQPAFAELLEVTSALRKEQEEESRNAERMQEQQTMLQSTQAMLQEAKARLVDARQNAQAHLTAEELMRNLEQDLKASEGAKAHLAGQQREHKSAIDRLGAKASEPRKTEGDVAALQARLRVLKEERASLNAQVEEAQRASGDDKLAFFRQNAQLLVRKIESKEEEIEKEKQTQVRLAGDIEGKEDVMKQLSGPQYMKRDEFQNFAKGLKEKTGLYKKLKAELQEVEMEGTVVLGRTVQLLEGRDGNLSELLDRLEARRGVSGYTDTEVGLRGVSERTQEVNKAKSMTLEEISRMVADINHDLKARKNKLAPRIKKLRTVRQEYQEMEQIWLEKKGVFDNMAVGLDTSRMKLEQECDAFQEDCLAQESRYHYLQSLIGIIEAQYNKVQQEMEYERGNGRLLRDFPSYKALYQHKIVQAEGMAKELRKQQKAMKEKEDSHIEQRLMFADLRKLLACKLKSTQQAELDQYHQDTGAGNLDQFDNIGGANVMTLGD